MVMSGGIQVNVRSVDVGRDVSNAVVMDYLRKDLLPHLWCPGCGNGIILGAFLRAFHESGLDRDKTVIVSGIGCSGRATQYLNFDTVHTTHGRALAFATGIKLAKPELNVVVMMGDGDALAIGGNHLIHAARRNIDLTTIIFNNSVYGMTGGQASPTTPEGRFTATTPYGNLESPFDVVELVLAAGATYVARWTTYHTRQLQKAIKVGLLHKGFSVIEVITGCPTHSKQKPIDLLKWQRENTTLNSKLQNKILVGVFRKVNSPEYTEKYYEIIQTKNRV